MTPVMSVLASKVGSLEFVGDSEKKSNMALDAYTSAAVSMIGMTFDSIGGLYLAYDLLGGERGPLSKLTRLATYSLMAFLMYLPAVNLKFALICGLGMGSLFGLHLDLLGAGKKPGLRFHIGIALSRMVILYFAVGVLFSQITACFMAVGGLIGSLASVRFKFSPDYWYEASRKPEFKISRLLPGLILGLLVFSLCYVGEMLSGDKLALARSLRMGLVIGLGTSLIANLSPFVEWYADNLPPKRMGYIGACMFVLGFFIQALPSLMVLLGY